MDHRQNSMTEMEDLKKYLRHLSTCWTQQNWSEAEQAMADTPEGFRDEGWQMAYNEIRRKRNTCNCGMEKVAEQFYPLPFIEWFRSDGFYTEFNEYGVDDRIIWEGPTGWMNTVRDLFEYWKREVMK